MGKGTGCFYWTFIGPLNIIFPPLGVLLGTWNICYVLLNILLTALGWIPGVIFAFKWTLEHRHEKHRKHNEKRIKKLGLHEHLESYEPEKPEKESKNKKS